MNVSWAAILMVLGCVLSGCSSLEDNPDFELSFKNAPVINFRCDFDQRLFVPCLEVAGVGEVCLDKGVCCYSYSTDSDQKQGGAGEKYNYGSARYGIDTKSIKVMTFNDLIYVEWNTLEQGNGGYIDREYRLFKKGIQLPLISGGIPIAGRWGWNTALSGKVEVASLESDHLWLVIGSTRFNSSRFEKPFYYFDPKYDDYIAKIELKKVVKYSINQQGKVSGSDGHVFYQMRQEDSLEEVAKYFHVSEDKLVLANSWVEIPLGPILKDKLFAPVYDGIARSLAGEMDLDL